MPYIKCIVASCKTRRKPNASKNEILKCFSVPKDPILKREWLDLCKVKEFDQAGDSKRKVCIKHFKEDDFEDGLKARLLHLQPRILKKNAVPSLFLNAESEDITNETQKGKQGKILGKLTEDTSKASTVQDRTEQKYGSKEYLSKLVPIAPKGPIIAPRGPTDRRQYAKFLKHYESTPKKPKVQVPSEHNNKVLQLDNAIYKKRIAELLTNQEELKKRIKLLESWIRKDEEELVDKIKGMFSRVLTSNQVDVIIGKKVRAWWNHEEYMKAYTLLHLNRNAYFYVRDTLNYPLPAFTSLQQWASRYGVDIPDCNDDDKVNPIPNHIKLTLDKIRKRNKKKNKTNCPSEQMDVPSDASETIDEEFTLDLKDEPSSEYLDIYDDSDSKQSATDDNTTLVETTSVKDEKFDNDDQMYAEIDYLEDDAGAAKEANILNYTLDNELDKNLSDDNEEMNEQVNEIDDKTDLRYKKLIICDLNEHGAIEKCSVVDKDNG